MRKPARAIGREMMPVVISLKILARWFADLTVNDEKPSPACHAVNSVEVLVGSSLEISAEHDSDVVRDVPYTSAFEHLLRLVPRA